MRKAIAWVLDGAGKPIRLDLGAVDLEKHLEDWVDADVSIVADDVLLIGRQVSTSFGTVLDLLGIDSEGNLVIIELKRDQTLRETVAQGIEYAAWCSKLLYDDVCSIASKRYMSVDNFKSSFETQFGQSLPDSLNGSQRIILVAPEITDATSAVIDYLSETYRFPINGVSFDVFNMNGSRIVVRQVVREVEGPPIQSKKRPPRSLEEFIEEAEANGVREAFEHILTMQDLLPRQIFSITSVAFRSLTPAKRWLNAFSIYPTSESNAQKINIWLYLENLGSLYSCSKDDYLRFAEELQSLGDTTKTPSGWFRVAVSTLEQAKEFDCRFRNFVASASGGTPVIAPIGNL